MSQESQDRVRHAYEAYTQMVLQAMVNYVEGDEAVDRMWIYTAFDNDIIETAPFFRYQGQLRNHGDIAQADTSRAYDPWALLDAFEDEVEVELLDALRAYGEVPQRIITIYNPIEGGLDSEWDYEGVLTGPEDSYGLARDRWIQSLGGTPLLGP